MNTLKTVVLLGFLSGLIMLTGAVFGGKQGLIIAFGMALVTNVASYWWSAPMALRMSGAVPISRDEAPDLYEVVEEIAAKAKIPTPDVYMIPEESPNAFATGRDPQHSSIAVTQGIMRLLNRDELAAVLSHELGHVHNRDILISTIAAVLASVVTFLAHWGSWIAAGEDDRPNPIFAILMMILAPIAATLINLAISRSREFEADKTGAELCGDPLALASALAKVEQWTQQIPWRDANPAISSLYIIKPNPGNWASNLMSTHPPTQERIARLQAMANHRH